MPNPNAIVSSVIRMPGPTPATAAAGPGAFVVELEGGRRANLTGDDPRTRGYLQILDGLQKLGRPVYLEVDPATSAITRLLIPHVARVLSLRPLEGGSIGVELDASHGSHTLLRGQPDFAELEAQLRSAQREGMRVTLTEDDQHHVIDVRPFTPRPEGPPIPEPEPRLPRRPDLWDRIRDLLRRIWFWPCWPWWWFGCMSLSTAQSVFNAMKATSCNPLTVPPPCIPFLYPDDGCWARAHEMCRLMIAMGHSPRKVWIDGSGFLSLRVATRNNPNCEVRWNWHVAPILCVRWHFFFCKRWLVIDPALFDTPVTQTVWKAKQSDPAATLYETDASVFWHGGGTDPTYSNSNAILANYRLALLNRSLLPAGPPPYAHCP